ncbi:Maf family protein [Ilumatobacter fluminis]|uniref:Maf family protein n=1 Tax=Ilumatobacter fluminis TaxID=467091 RepID=UPI001060DD41|nr:Maf family protein [Ilumatobacter fluminis]
MTGGSSTELVLASQSPRRHELLRGLGLTFRVEPADVDESWERGEDPRAYVERVAIDKAEKVAHLLDRDGGICVLAADTTVDLDDDILAKPDDDAHARQMLEALSGRAHQVHTAVVGWTAREAIATVVTTDVTFRTLTDADIDWYLGIGEHLDKAGAYGMQTAGGALVERIDGSPSNVIGLPLAETIDVLRACGVTVARV